jgi:hypothetical protein
LVLERCDHHKRRHLVTIGRVHQPLRAEHVVLDGLAGVPFHHRHVLVRRCVKDDVGAVLLEHGFESFLVADVAD